MSHRILGAVLCVSIALLAAQGMGCGGGGAGGGGGGGGGNPGQVALGVFPAANVVIGQADFVSFMQNQGGAAGANTLAPQFGRLHEGSLYVPDTQNHRILGFNPFPAANNANAVFVLGQPNFTSTTPGTTANSFDAPTSFHSNTVNSAVADPNNHRVLLYNGLPVSNVNADVVVGQLDFVSGGSGLTDSTMNLPLEAMVIGGKLIVSDVNNNRVLIWNAVPAANGAAADVVVGQPNFTSGGTATTQAGLDAPTGIWSDGTRLAVADTGNNRVLIWNTIPTTNGANADVVVGQPDFVSGAANQGGAPSASTLSFPFGVNSNGSQFFVADANNNRVLIHDVIPTTNNRPADAVVGQSDFVHVTANDDDQDDAIDLGPTARTFATPSGVFPRGQQLVVLDVGNSRALVFGP